MKKKLLLFMLCLSVGMTALSQNKTDIYGLLTTMDHPSKATQGAILAIMTDEAYIPIQIKEGCMLQWRIRSPIHKHYRVSLYS